MSRFGERSSGERIDPVVAEFHDFLPEFGLMPMLSPEDVQGFVALGAEGRDRMRGGDLAAASAAFRGQIEIFPPNPEPWVSLALAAASGHDTQAALGYLRAAVVRGFTDLQQVRRAEAWTSIGQPNAWLDLIDALPKLAEVERGWPEWATFRSVREPGDPESIRLGHEAQRVRIEAMAPALGPRLVRLWNKILAREAAARLEAYVTRHPDAADLETALGRLTALLAGDVLEHWGAAPREAAPDLVRVSNLVLERFPESAMRPEALVARAAGRSVVRDRKGTLEPQAGEDVRRALGEVVTRHADSPLLSTAVVGLVLTERELGRETRAAEVYREFRERHASNAALLARVREDLGPTALRLAGLPAFEATTLDGRTVSPEALRGRVAIVDFWATWCNPCLEAMPTLRRIDERHGESVVVLGVNLNDADELSADALREWIASQGVPGEQVHDGLSWDSALARAFGVKEIPFNVVIGPNGDVLAVNEQGKRLEKTVQAALQR